MKSIDSKPTRAFRSSRAFAAWLARNSAKSDGLWLRLAKKDSGIPSVSYAEAVEIALCYGWIDGQVRSDDASYYRQKFTPRARRSLWSKINRAKALALIAEGRMQPAGLREVERAQADGRWDVAYDSPKTMGVPADFASALRSNAAAKKTFETLSKQNRFAILFRLATAKKPETRARRLEKFLGMLARGESIHP